MMSEAEVVEDVVEEVEDVVEDVVDEAQTPSDDEKQQAMSMGWSEKDKWRGPEDEWVDAHEFIERGKKINPILRKNNERLNKEINSLRERLDTQSQTFQEFLERDRKKMQKEADQRIKSLLLEKRDAINDGDGDKVIQIEEQIEDARSSVPDEPAQSPNKADPIFEVWVEENPWLQKAVNQQIANAIGEELKVENPLLSRQEFLDEVATRSKRVIANLAPEKQSRTRPSAVESPRAVKQSKKKSFSSLPADAQAQAKRYEQEGLMTVDEYVKEYEWEE